MSKPEPSHEAESTVAAAGSSRRIRVLQFAYGTSLYGAERWILNLLKHLDPDQVESHVASIRDRVTPDLPFLKEAARAGHRTHVIEAPGSVVATSCRELRRIVRDHGIEIIHSHGTRQDVISLIASRGLGCKILSTPHGWEVKAPLRTRFLEALNRWTFVFFDGVAPLSQGLLDSLRRIPIPARRLSLIRNAVDLSEIETTPALEGILPGQQSQQDFVVGYVGQLSPRKGVEVLLQALARLPERGWCCLLLGDGPSRADLEHLVGALGLAERVRFLGFRRDRLAFIKRFGVLVLPSYLEGIPRTLMEAMGSEIVAVASDIPGVTDLIEQGVTGFTFAPGSAGELAAVLEQIRERPDDAARVARAGRDHVYSNFTSEAMAKSYGELYASLLGRPPVGNAAPSNRGRGGRSSRMPS